jgi:DNA-binding transcriptional MerR regulator
MTAEAQRSNDKLAWFFTDPASRYTLNCVVLLTGCSRDDVQNWVKRGLVEPDEIVSGNRIYSPVTVATLAIAADLRLQGVSANNALMHASLVTDAAFRWFAGEDIPDGTIPAFEKDFRQHYAVLAVYEDERSRAAQPSGPDIELLRGVVKIGIIHRSEIDSWLDWPVVCIVRLHYAWLSLAEAAKTLRERSARWVKKDEV